MTKIPKIRQNLPAAAVAAGTAGAPGRKNTPGRAAAAAVAAGTAGGTLPPPVYPKGADSWVCAENNADLA